MKNEIRKRMELLSNYDAKKTLNENKTLNIKKNIDKILNQLFDYYYYGPDIDDDFHVSDFLFKALKSLNYPHFDEYFKYYMDGIEGNIINLKSNQSIDFSGKKLQDFLFKELVELIFYKGKFDEIVNKRYVSNYGHMNDVDYAEYLENIMSNFKILVDSNVFESSEIVNSINDYYH
jgi:hypothetical protein